MCIVFSVELDTQYVRIKANHFRSSRYGTVGSEFNCSSLGCCRGGGSIPGPAQWVKGCGLDSFPGLGTSICHGCGHKRKKKVILLRLQCPTQVYCIALPKALQASILCSLGQGLWRDSLGWDPLCSQFKLPSPHSQRCERFYFPSLTLIFISVFHVAWCGSISSKS